VDHAQYVDAIRGEGAALAAAARDAGVDVTVPSCPEWTIADLLSHLGRIHHWVAGIVTERRQERGTHWSENAAPPVDARLEWFECGVELLADALDAAGPDIAVWTWTPDTTTSFWARRQAHETAIHRVDAQLARRQLASDVADPVDRERAVDGIDELFDLIPYWPWADRVRGDGETVHVHCTDGEGEWFARLNPDGLVVTREHAKGDVALRGTASDLLLGLYGRMSIDALDVIGNAAVLTRWRELVSW
jgi:uncharacterized protein (TIGR03083 family)